MVLNQIEMNNEMLVALQVAEKAALAVQRKLLSGDKEGYRDAVVRHQWLMKVILQDGLRLVDDDVRENVFNHSFEWEEMQENVFYGNTIYPVEVEGVLYFFW